MEKENNLITYNPNTISNPNLGHQKQTHVIHKDKRNKRQGNKKQRLERWLKEE